MARHLKGGMDSGADPLAVLVDCQDHVVAVGRAHIEHLLLEAFKTRRSPAWPMV